MMMSEIADIHLDVETVVPLGLVINELQTNALKYEFPGDIKDVIGIEWSELDNVFVLVVRDNGIGICNVDNILNGYSFGYSMISVFASKLETDLLIQNAEGKKVTLKIKNYKKLNLLNQTLEKRLIFTIQ